MSMFWLAWLPLSMRVLRRASVCPAGRQGDLLPRWLLCLLLPLAHDVAVGGRFDVRQQVALVHHRPDQCGLSCSRLRAEPHPKPNPLNFRFLRAGPSWIRSSSSSSAAN
jgi:hypothetical protein